MKDINVLVTAAGGPTAMGILKCLSGINGVHLFGAEAQQFTSANAFCDDIFLVPKVGELDAYQNRICEIVRTAKIDIIFPTLQAEITVYHTFADSLPAFVAVPKSDSFDVLVNKEKLYAYLKEQGFSSILPKYAVFDSSYELKEIMDTMFHSDQFVCVKNTAGHGGIGVAILTDRNTYINHLRDGKRDVISSQDYIDADSKSHRMVMEYLDGVEFSVDLFLSEGKVVTAVSRRRKRVSNGVVIDGVVEENQFVLDAAKEIAEKVATDGFLNLQFIESQGTYKLTDLNARFCGSQVMSYGAGVNFPLLAIQYNLLGERPVPMPIWNTRMVRYWESCFCHD